MYVISIQSMSEHDTGCTTQAERCRLYDTEREVRMSGIIINIGSEKVSEKRLEKHLEKRSEKLKESLTDSLHGHGDAHGTSLDRQSVRRTSFEEVALPIQEENKESHQHFSALDELKANVSHLTEMHARLRFVMREVSGLVRKV